MEAKSRLAHEKPESSEDGSGFLFVIFRRGRCDASHRVPLSPKVFASQKRFSATPSFGQIMPSARFFAPDCILSNCKISGNTGAVHKTVVRLNSLVTETRRSRRAQEVDFAKKRFGASCDMRLLQPLLDADGKVKRWPKKAAERTAVLEYFAEWFEAGKYYAEMEVNAIIGLMQTVSDICVFRREFINAKMLERVG